MSWVEVCEVHLSAKHAGTRGSGGMPHRKFLKKRCKILQFGDIST